MSCCKAVGDGVFQFEGTPGANVRVVLIDRANCQYWTGAAWAASNVAAIDANGFQAVAETCNDGATASYQFTLPAALRDQTNPLFRRFIKLVWSSTAGESWAIAGATTNKCQIFKDLLEIPPTNCEVTIAPKKECYAAGETARFIVRKKCCNRLTAFVNPVATNLNGNTTVPLFSVSTGVREAAFLIPAGTPVDTLFPVRITETLADDTVLDCTDYIRVCAPQNDPFDRLCGTGVVTAKVANNYAPDTFGDRLCRDPFDRLCSTGVFTTKVAGNYAPNTVGEKICVAATAVDPFDRNTDTGAVTPKVGGVYAPGTHGKCVDDMCALVPAIVPAINAARDVIVTNTDGEVQASTAAILARGGTGPWTTGAPGGGSMVDPFDRAVATGAVLPKTGTAYATGSWGACLSSVCTILPVLPGAITGAKDEILTRGGNGPWTTSPAAAPLGGDPFDRHKKTGAVLPKVNGEYAPDSVGACICCQNVVTISTG